MLSQPNHATEPDGEDTQPMLPMKTTVYLITPERDGYATASTPKQVAALKAVGFVECTKDEYKRVVARCARLELGTEDYSK